MTYVLIKKYISRTYNLENLCAILRNLKLYLCFFFCGIFFGAVETVLTGAGPSFVYQLNCLGVDQTCVEVI